MASEYAEASRELRKRSLQLKIVVLRQAARRFLDIFQFGNGVVERLIAAVVLSAVFLLIFLAVAAAMQQPTEMVLALGAASLITALSTSSIFVMGPSDEDLKAKRVKLTEDIVPIRQRVAELRSEDKDRKREEHIRKQTEESARRAEAKTRATEAGPARKPPQKATCPYCHEEIEPSAVKCPHCLEYLDRNLAARRKEIPSQPQSNPGVAAVLSFFFPGLGQIYKRQVLGGLLWYFLVMTTYVLSILTLGCCIGFVGVPVAIVLHLICIFDAASA